MARVCQLTGKRTRSGNNVSHANNKTKRKFYPNLQKKRFFLESTGEWITMKVATSAIKTINKNGIEATLLKSAERGLLSGRIVISPR
ncbi:MAG: 50S ribosomal protein L28 [Rudanella sp.]|jgi:large subunit ribosomal protein L28|nr:50S ribosomal protein L28 [Rudanella sp.]